MKEFNGIIGNCPIRISIGNMIKEKAGAYLVPHFSAGVNYGGIAGAVARFGAQLGVEEYEEFVNKNGPQPFGQVKITKSYGGNAEFLLHAVTVGSGAATEFDVARTATQDSLKLCEKNGIATLIVPALGTGIVGELADQQSAKAMLSAIDRYSKAGGKAVDISFVFLDREPEEAEALFAAFTKVLKDKSYENAPSEVGRRKIDVGRWAQGMQYEEDENTRHAQNAVPLQAKRDIPVKTIKLRKPGL